MHTALLSTHYNRVCQNFEQLYSRVLNFIACIYFSILEIAFAAREDDDDGNGLYVPSKATPISFRNGNNSS